MTAPVRLTLAAAAVAFAIWLAPASIHIADWSSAEGPTRVALLQPLSRWWVAVGLTTAAIAAIAVGWTRRRPLGGLATALTPFAVLLVWAVPYLPWLPDRAPLLLVFAGPLRWALLAAACVGCVAELRPVPVAWREWQPHPRRLRAAVFVVSFAVYAVCGLRSLDEKGLSGDEPHYLIITHSLLVDHDLDIANNHEQRDYRGFYGGPLRPDFLRRGLRGEVYSVHAPGLSALLVPAYAVGGAAGAVLFVAFLSAWCAAAVFDGAVRVTGAPTTGLLAWASVCLTVPFMPHAWSLYPEAAAALIVAWAVSWLWREPAAARWQVLHGCALAFLPWLHTKFVVLLALIAIVEAIRLWTVMKATKSLVAFAAPIAASSVLWLYSFHRMYGEFDPQAPYGAFPATFVLMRNIPRGLIGLLFDQKFGLFIYAPVFLLAAVGAWHMLRDPAQRSRTVALLAIFAVFAASSTRLYMWWGGASAPARFLVPAVPLLAPMIATAIERWRSSAGHAAVWGTLCVSVAIAAAGVLSSRQQLFYSNPHGFSALVDAIQGAAPLERAMPTFTEETWPRLATLVPWIAAAIVTWLLVRLLRRAKWIRSPFSIGAATVLLFLTTAALAAGRGPAQDRAAVVLRGRLALLQAYDPSRLHAVDSSHVKRLSPNEARDRAALVLPFERDRDHGIVHEPLALPEGRYEAHIAFDQARARSGDGIVRLGENVTLARAPAGAASRLVIPFELPVGAGVLVALTDPAAASDARAVTIEPRDVVARSLRLPGTAVAVERLDGGRPGLLAYLDDSSYPEGGVFWTRDSERADALVIGAGSSMRLIVHVGPNAGTVELSVGDDRRVLEMNAGETRELVVPIRSERTHISARARRSFRPAEVDAHSEDQRRLGCQIRAQLQ